MSLIHFEITCIGQEPTAVLKYEANFFAIEEVHASF
jgi:hypothetical protein